MDGLTRRNKKLHDAAAKYYKILCVVTCMICEIVLGSTGGILDIALGGIEPVSFV